MTLDTRLREALQSRADAVVEPPDLADLVMSRATKIKRRRGVIAATGVAVTVALVAVTPPVLHGKSQRGNVAIDDPRPTPPPSSSPHDGPDAWLEDVPPLDLPGGIQLTAPIVVGDVIYNGGTARRFNRPGCGVYQVERTAYGLLVLCVATGDGAVYSVDLVTETGIRNLEYLATTGNFDSKVLNIAVSADGKRAAWGIDPSAGQWATWDVANPEADGPDGSLKIVDLASGRPLEEIRVPDPRVDVKGFAGDRVLLHLGGDRSGSYDAVWDPATHRLTPLAEGENFDNFVDGQPLGDLAAVIAPSRRSPDRFCLYTVRLPNVTTPVWNACDPGPWKPVNPDSHEDASSASFSPDGSLLFVGAKTGGSVIDVATGGQVAELHSPWWQGWAVVAWEDASRLIVNAFPDPGPSFPSVLLRCDITSQSCTTLLKDLREPVYLPRSHYLP